MTLRLLSLWVLLIAVGPAFAEEADSPHRMMKPDGSIDTDKCGLCHEPDMSLSRSKTETCTLCHAMTTHAGSSEHLHVSPASVTRLLASAEPGAPKFPLTAEGGIFCGTCHLFHDPRIAEEKPLAEGWLPPSTGLSEAVRGSLEDRWEELARKYKEPSAGATFATRPTKALRLPVSDGALCRHCHGYTR